MRRRRAIRVPASSANLGPGYDVLAAALSLHLELEVQETGDELAVQTDLAIPTGRENLCVRGFERLRPADGFSFRIRSQIPLSGGLGSSAAAILAGLMAADHIFELDADVEALAVELEGHPDNVAAALHGGFVVCAPGRAAVRMEPPTGLEGVLVIPTEAVATEAARAALAPEVPREAAVFNVAHTAVLMLGLARGDWDLVSAGLRDQLHQDARAHLYPRSHALLERARELGALGATISGAGPTVLVWSHYELTGSLVEGLRAQTDGWAEVRRVTFESQGARVAALA
ncbi:MAG: homoserine kinase [Solirubrobacterales bacterium]|nr:MAG: homoserine kinase [Solirubrobacterales bacterium]